MTVTASLKTAAQAPRYSIANTYGDSRAASFRYRMRRFEHLKPLIERIIAEKGRCRIADIGGTEYYWAIFGSFVEDHPIEIDLINLNPQKVTKAAFRSIAGDATSLTDMADDAYDLVHSNSVIEHVGNWDKMRAFAANVRRLAPVYFVQTPNFWFPYEPHFRAPFFHWLPEPVRCTLLMKLNLGFGGQRVTIHSAMRGLQSVNIIGKSQLQALFPDACIIHERAFGLTKSFMAVRNER
jgi:hypothetical protein